MTLVEAYEAQPQEIKCLVEQYTLNSNWAGEIMDNIMKIVPDKQATLSALVEAYGVYISKQDAVLEELKANGIDERMAFNLGLGYGDRCSNN